METKKIILRFIYINYNITNNRYVHKWCKYKMWIHEKYKSFAVSMCVACMNENFNSYKPKVIISIFHLSFISMRPIYIWLGFYFYPFYSGNYYITLSSIHWDSIHNMGIYSPKANLHRQQTNCYSYSELSTTLITALLMFYAHEKRFTNCSYKKFSFEQLIDCSSSIKTTTTK